MNCEVCSEKLTEDQSLSGCEQCARMFGPCCNSVQPNYCVDCGAYDESDLD